MIYFDVSPYSQKMGYPIVQLINRYYDEIQSLFASSGLEFCFLPRISRTLQYSELYAYFHPDSPETGHNPYWNTVTADNLAKYYANDEDIDDLPMGLIKYTGQQFGNDYVFSFVPITGRTEDELFTAVKYYLQFYSDSGVRPTIQDFHGHGSINVEEKTYYYRSQESVGTLEGSADIDSMLSQAQRLVEQLRENGVNDLVIEEIFHPTRQLSRLLIRNSRIFLPDYQNMEIKMSPLPRAVFLLYLKHPEGIRFCDLPGYRDELYHIYASFSGRDNVGDIRASIDDVTNPIGNSINEKCSRIRQAFLSRFEDRLARNYYITGERGTAKKITLPRDMVIWED